MIARLICLLLGHALDELETIEGVPPPVSVRRGKCARCKAPIITVHDLRDEEGPKADVDTIDDR